MAWFWDEASDQSEDGNAHVGYGIGIDMENISAEELESLNSAFPPASGNYSVDDIVYMRLVHWEKSDADGNVIHDWYHVQHFDENYDTLGQVGYDVENDLYITNEGARIQFTDTPDSEAASSQDVMAAKTLFQFELKR